MSILANRANTSGGNVDNGGCLYREAWRAKVHGVTKSRTSLSDRTTTTCLGAWESLSLPLTFSVNLAAAAKSLQSCPALCDPMDSSPPGSSIHRIL